MRKLNTNLPQKTFPRGRYYWDCWFLRSGAQVHAFFLQAQKTPNPDDRHNHHVSIGHAVSTDLKKWRYLGTALKPGRSGAWDDLALWTGSAVRRGGRSYLFYTGRCSEKSSIWIQKIGVAVSDDLQAWQRLSPAPIVCCDPRRYQLYPGKNRIGRIGAWRDPFVFKDPVSRRWCMLISARARSRRQEFNACIGLAVSDDLRHWQLRDPILAPHYFDEMECSQMVVYRGCYYLFFSVMALDPSLRGARKRPYRSGLYCFSSASLEGPYLPAAPGGLVIDYGTRYYAAALAARRGALCKFIGWRHLDPEGRFLGGLSEVFRVKLEGRQARLCVD